MVRLINEQPSSVFIDRARELAIFSLTHLRIAGIVPVTITTLPEAEVWVQANLSQQIAAIHRSIVLASDGAWAFRGKEKKLFLDPSKRSEWLSHIGLGKRKTGPPRVIAQGDGTIFKPNDICQLYLDKVSPLLRRGRPLPGTPGTSEPRELMAPDIDVPRPFIKVDHPNPQDRPSWWDRVYSRKAKGIQDQIWSSLMSPVTIREVLDTINSLKSGTASDMDGNSSDTLKLFFTTDSPLTPYLVSLINHILVAGDVPRSWKLHYISLIEKTPGSLQAETLEKDVRPISIINEYAKLVSKLLANRLNQILLDQEVVTPAQRAFLKNGSVHQCITTMLNILEDALHKRRLRPKASLYLILYDQAKAYDSVQRYSIRASLERFNMPESFITYCMNMHTHINAMFKTFYGLTDPFLVENSIKQGDPLAPLIFVLFTDALHEGLKTSPIFTDDIPTFKHGRMIERAFSGGYKFLGGNLVIPSLGYADDLSVIAEHWSDCWAQHEWVLSFFSAHNQDLNAKKTMFIISDATENDPRWLYSVDRQSAIRPLPSSTIFRFLGIYTNINLDWKKQIAKMASAITLWGNKVLSTGISSLKVLETFKMTLLPRLDLGLSFANIPLPKCNRWSRQILRYVLSADHHPRNLIPSISLAAFADLVGCPSIYERLQGNQLKELLYNLNSDSYAGLSTRSRLEQLTDKKHEWGVNLYGFRLTKRYKLSRFAALIEYWRRQEVKLVSPPCHTSYYLDKLQNFILPTDRELLLFTDGSSIKSNTISGTAVVARDMGGATLAKIGIPILSYGNNYLAELAALTFAAKLAPNLTRCTIYSASLSSILSATGGPMSERERVRTPCRGWLSTFRKDLAMKPNLSLQYTPAHTNASDPLSKGNDMADRVAKLARESHSDATPPPLVTLDTLGVYLEFKGQILMGGVKEDIRKILRVKRSQKWKLLSKQGRTLKNFRTIFPRVQRQIRRYAISSGREQMWSYFILATLRWFTPPPRGKSPPSVCRLCDGSVPDTIDHFLACPGLKDAHEMIDTDLQHHLSLLGVHLPFPLTFLSSHPHPLSDSVAPRRDYPVIVENFVRSANLADKQAAIAGFLPLSLRNLLMFFRPHTYREDFEELRLLIVDLCARRYHVYRLESWKKWLASMGTS